MNVRLYVIGFAISSSITQMFCVVASELLRLRFKVSNLGFYYLNLAMGLTVCNTSSLQAASQS